MLLDKACRIILCLHHTCSEFDQVLQLLFPQCACDKVHVTMCISPCAFHTSKSTSCSAFVHFLTFICNTKMVVLCCKLSMCRDDLFTTMLPKYRDILRHEADLDILIFSGDVDGIVPVIGTRRWLASLQLPILKEWRPWYSHTGESWVETIMVHHPDRNCLHSSKVHKPPSSASRDATADLSEKRVSWYVSDCEGMQQLVQ